MKIEVLDILKLSDNLDYGVVSVAKYEEKTYYYLVNTLEPTNYKICSLKDNHLKEVTDDKLLVKIIPKFFKNSEELIKVSLKQAKK